MDFNFEVPKARKHIFGIRLDALIEMALFLTLALMIDQSFFEGDRFYDMKPHPFWALILIMTVFYGTAEGIVCAIISSVVLLFNNMPPEQFNQDPFSYLLAVSLKPMLWLAAATIIGGFHDLRVGTIERVRGLYNEAKEREEVITKAYQKVEQLAKNLEKQLIGELSGQAAVYVASGNLTSGDPDKIYESISEMFINGLGAEKLSVYFLNGSALDLTFRKGWGETESFGSKFKAGSPLFSAIVGEGRVVSVNNPKDEAVLEGEGLMAAPLFHNTTGEVIGMVKIEKLPFANLNQTTVFLFRTLAGWVGTVMVNQQQMMKSLQNQISEGKTGLYSTNLLQRDKALIGALACRMGFELASIEATLKGGRGIDEIERQELAQQLYQAVQKCLRQTDIVFLAEEMTTNFSILLPGASKEGCKVVIDKINKELKDAAKQMSLKAEMIVTEKDFSKFAKEKKKR